MPEPMRKTRRPKNKNALLVAKTSLVALSMGAVVGGFGILAGADVQAAAQSSPPIVPDAPLNPITAPATAPTAMPARPDARQDRRQVQPTTPRATTPQTQPQGPQIQPQQPQAPQVQPRQPQFQQPQLNARPQARTRSSR